MTVHALGRAVRVGAGEAVLSDLQSLEFRGKYQGPPRIEADLLGYVLLLADGESELLLIVLDLLELWEPWMRRFKAAIRRSTGIAEDRQVVLCNHIHSAANSEGVPEVALAWRLAPAVEQARKQLAAAKVAFARRDLGSRWTLRRRFEIDSLETFCVMFNDDCHAEGDRLEISGQAAKHLAGKGVDPSIWSGHGSKQYCDPAVESRLELISFASRQGDPIATIVRFAAHAVITSHVWIGNTLYPDFIGEVRQVLGREVGGKVLFLQGPMGDVKPLQQEYGFESATEYGQRLGREAVALAETLEFAPLEAAALAMQRVPLPLRPEYFITASQRRNQRDNVLRQADGTKSPAERLKLLRQAEVLDWVEFFLVKKEIMVTPKMVADRAFPAMVSAWRFNDIRLAGLPGEIFGATGQRLVEQAGGDRLVVAELADGYIGYLSPTEEYGTGGYEDTSCVLAKGADRRLVDAASDALGAV
ncbi:MAG TPA: hypothetical protein VMZ31_19910 [Phycisphaerae bacterium]|nr:hypothetical protein [Phycisphaerae bacterium]